LKPYNEHGFHCKVPREVIQHHSEGETLNKVEKANHYINQFDKELTKYPALNAFEQRTQVPKAYAVLGGFFFLTVLLAINPLAAPVSNLVGWLLPAYLSFKAIESPSPHDDVQWLTYWVVFGFFNFIESFALRMVLYYLPWYFAMKTMFIVWLQLPAFRGAQITYLNVLKPLLTNVSSQSRTVAPTTSTTEPSTE